MSWRDHHYRSNLSRRNANQWNRSWEFLGQNFFYRVAIPRCNPRYSRVDYRKDISSRIPDANFDAFLRETQNRRDTKRYSSAGRSQVTPMFELLWASYAEIYAVDTARLERNRSHICECNFHNYSRRCFTILSLDPEIHKRLKRWARNIAVLDFQIFGSIDIFRFRYLYLHVCKYVDF